MGFFVAESLIEFEIKLIQGSREGRKILLDQIHMADLHFNRHCNEYDSVFSESMKRYTLQGKCGHRYSKGRKLKKGSLVNVLEI